MSLERVLKLLEEFGFSRGEAEVYIYLAKTGPQIPPNIINNLKISNQQLHPILTKLQEKGAITANSDRLVLYSALAFEELLNQYIKLNLLQAKNIKTSKQELLANWKNLPQNNNHNKDQKN